MYGSSIKSRVMARVKAKIAEAQKEYDNGCLSIDERAAQEKENLAEQLVDSIIKL